MPIWSIRLQRCALVHLILGFGLGAILLGARPLGLAVPFGPLIALHQEVLLVGWTVQFTLGVAHWMLPKHAQGPPHGSKALVAASCLLLNAGVLLAGIGRVFLMPPVLALGRTAECAAVLAFALNALPRIKPFGAGRMGSRDPTSPSA